MLPALSGYLSLLVITLAVELVVGWLLAPKPRRRTVTLTLLYANLLTHPLATLLMTGAGDRLPFFAVEGAVWLVEAIALQLVARPGPLRAGVITAVANALTAALSFLLAAA